MKQAVFKSAAFAIFLFATSTPELQARSWKFTGVSVELEAEFVGMSNGWVVLQDTKGKSFELDFDNFSPADQQFIRAITQPVTDTATGKPVTSRKDYEVKSVESLTGQTITLTGASELHVTGKGDPIAGSSFIFTSPDAWLFLDHIKPSVVESEFLDRMRANGARAKSGENVRVVQHASGSVIIPHDPDFTAMTVYDGGNLSGSSIPLKCHVEYDHAKLARLQESPASFVLKRGYMATIAEKENGTGTSRNYVAQDHDLVINTLPAGLDKGLSFIRIFPWRWTSKKGVAGGIWQNLNVGWFYDWNIGAESSPDLEYVAIKQKLNWPGMDQDWKKKGINHLLGYNEPDHKDQSDLTVDQAISGWPELLGTGLRLGSPAPSDGGLNWLYEFMGKADAAGLRVDFVAVHYYRAVANPKDAKGAANQFYQFLKGIHDRVKRPLWITEWNNGANWTKEPDPNTRQQQEAIEEIIKMLDETPFVERYAIYNWVEDVRHVQDKDGKLTPAGESYRDNESPVAFTQPRSEK